MDTIYGYLESMFAKLPNTPEVRRAREELRQMMEDKYTEMRNQGKTENEAVGMVISEFGNLEEIAELLGIHDVVKPGYQAAGEKILSQAEVNAFVADHTKASLITAIGVMLCIASPVGLILSSSVEELSAWGDAWMALGLVFFFGAIAAAVGGFVYSSHLTGRWKSAGKHAYHVDYGTTESIHRARESYRMTYALMQTIGVVLCVASIVPASVAGAMKWSSPVGESIGASLMFIMVGIGVMLLVAASGRMSAYKKILRLNGSDTIGGHFVESQEEEDTYQNPTVRAIMSVYYPTVTCLYLIISFLTFRWDISWIIWPCAGVLHMFLKNLFK